MAASVESGSFHVSQYKSADVVFVGSVVTITSEGLGPQKKIVFSIEQNVKGLRNSPFGAKDF